MTPRGLLLSLGAKIADLPPDVVEVLSKPISKIETANGLKIDVVELNVRHERSMIDATSFGDSSPVMMEGLTRTRFEIRGFPHVGFDPHAVMAGDTIPFAYDLGGGKRVHAQLVITNIEIRSAIDSLDEAFIEAEAVGGVTFTEPPEKKPTATAVLTESETQYRRGIKL